MNNDLEKLNTARQHCIERAGKIWFMTLSLYIGIGGYLKEIEKTDPNMPDLAIMAVIFPITFMSLWRIKKEESALATWMVKVCDDEASDWVAAVNESYSTKNLWFTFLGFCAVPSIVMGLTLFSVI